jgi:uncharacterized protein YjbI with pentapeptide repeats
MGGVVVLGGLYVAYQNLMTLHDGQITDRFTKAVEQLGNQDPSVRLGGIFSLERMARESERDHPAVMEILSAYVRAHSKDQDPSRRPDIGAAMLVIGRRRTGRDDASGGTVLNLREVDLSKLDLTRGNYAGMSFVKAKFSDATLADTQFDSADLTDSDFDGADLRQATFGGRTKLTNASLRRARLFHAVLHGADLSGAVLTGANLWHSDLTEADFTGAKLDSSFLLEADFRGAHLQGADVKGAVVLSTQFDSASEKPTNIPSEPPAPEVTGVLHAHPHVPVGKDSPAQPGEFLEIYCKGLGGLRWAKEWKRTSNPRTAEVVHVMIDGKEAAAPDYAGISPTDPAGYQVNFQFPKVQPGKHSLKLVMKGRSSEGFEIESGSPR